MCKRSYVTPFVCVLAFLLLCWTAHSQIPVAIAPVPKLQFLDVNGKPLVGGCVFTYAAGTTSPLATYTDSTGTTQNTNPVILDSSGRASVWFSSSAYKIAVWSTGGVGCATGIQQYSIDGIAVANLNSANQLISSAASPASAGFIRMANGDLVNWRSIANLADIGLSQAGAATAGEGNLADVLRYGTSTTGGIQAQRFFDNNGGPGNFGVYNCSNNFNCVNARGASGSFDVNMLRLDSSNIVHTGTASSGFTFDVGPINFNSQTFSNVPGFSMAGALNVTANSGLPAGAGGSLWLAGNFGSPIVGKVYVGDGTGWELDLAKRVSSADTTLFKFQDNGNFTLLSGSLTLGGDTVQHHAHFFCSGFSVPVNAQNGFQRCYATQPVTIEALDYNTNSTPGSGCTTQPTIGVCYGFPACTNQSQTLTLTNGNAIGDSTISAFNIPANTVFAVQVVTGPAGCTTNWTNVNASATVREQ